MSKSTFFLFMFQRPRRSPAASPSSLLSCRRRRIMTRQAEPPLAEDPVTSAAAAWSARVAQGTNSLHARALHGKNVIPAKGGNPSPADADVTAAVNFMVAQSR